MTYLRHFLTLIALSLLTATTAAAQGVSPVLPFGGSICEDSYALCTSAPCVPDPSDPLGKAICTCEVASGPNYGIDSTCEERKIKQVTEVAQTLRSTYSFVQAPSKPVMTCDGTRPWTYCLDKPCVVDPKNPLKAICTCDIITDAGSYVTYGGQCNTNTCENAVWSGAAVEAFAAGSKALMDHLSMTEPPFQFCPGQTPADALLDLLKDN